MWRLVQVGPNYIKDRMTPVNCSSPGIWELAIVSWTVHRRCSSLWAINNHCYTVRTHQHTYYTHTWNQATYSLIQGCTKQFWWLSPLRQGNWLSHQPFQSTPAFVGFVSIHVFKQPLCAVHTYFPVHSSTLARAQEVLYSALVSLWPVLIFLVLDPSPSSLSLSLFLQENLRQLIMIPLPNVLLLGRTPYCGMLF